MLEALLYYVIHQGSASSAWSGDLLPCLTFLSLEIFPCSDGDFPKRGLAGGNATCQQFTIPF